MILLPSIFKEFFKRYWGICNDKKSELGVDAKILDQMCEYFQVGYNEEKHKIFQEFSSRLFGDFTLPDPEKIHSRQKNSTSTSTIHQFQNKINPF